MNVFVYNYVICNTGPAESPPPTVCSNGFYADISNHHQMQQYISCLKTFLSNFGSSEIPWMPMK